MSLYLSFRSLDHAPVSTHSALFVFQVAVVEGKDRHPQLDNVGEEVALEGGNALPTWQE